MARRRPRSVHGGARRPPDPKPRHDLPKASHHRAPLILLLLTLNLACQEAAPPSPAPESTVPQPTTVTWFEDVTAAAGIDFHHQSGAHGAYLYPESMVGGVGLCDVDADGDLDLYLVQSGTLDPTAGERPGNVLYRNRGDGTFDDVTATAGVGDPGYGMGVACGDIDADGDIDLYITNVGPNVLYHNRGDGTFDDVTATAGVGDPGWGASAVFLDADADGDLDLFVTNYLAWSASTEQDCRTPAGEREYCGPSNYRAPARDVLYENLGPGPGGVVTFADATERSGLHRAFGNGLGATAADLDGDGTLDLYVANDQLPNQLWLNRGDGTFRDEALLSGTAVNRRGMAEAGMGVMAVDVEHDGDLDLFLSHLAGETNTLYRNLADRGQAGLFADATASSGLAAASLPLTGFGLGFADFDHDGRLDLYIANGRVTRGRPLYDPSDPYAEPDLLFRGLGNGTFEETPQADPPARTGRGAAFGDLDGDGDLDIVVANRDAAPLVLRNVAAAGEWIQLRVLDRHGVDALGATVRLETAAGVQWRHVQPGYSYLASSDPRVHFGLGAARRVERVEVRWPGGGVEAFGPLAAGAVHQLRQGTGRPSGG